MSNAFSIGVHVLWTALLAAHRRCHSLELLKSVGNKWQLVHCHLWWKWWWYGTLQARDTHKFMSTHVLVMCDLLWQEQRHFNSSYLHSACVEFSLQSHKDTICLCKAREAYGCMLCILYLSWLYFPVSLAVKKCLIYVLELGLTCHFHWRLQLGHISAIIIYSQTVCYNNNHLVASTYDSSLKHFGPGVYCWMAFFSCIHESIQGSFY